MAPVSTTRGKPHRPGVPRSKTAVPRVPPRYRSRPRLLERLDGSTGDEVVVVSAPAGYGKTQLLAEWAARAPGATAWVSLDEDDNDDHRFWSAVLTAVECAVADDGLLRRLAVPHDPSADPVFLAAVEQAFDALDEPVRLVLDDVHELTAAGPLHGLAALVRDRSPRVRVVLAGRTDPLIPVARMRLAGELCEIRANLLRFSLAEAEALLASEEVQVRPEQLRLLVDQTEGWPAGLRLAALSLRGEPDPARFFSDLAGNGRAVSDYLVGEILSRLPAATVALLGAVSICDQLSAELAAALAGRADAGEVLDTLERETAMVVSAGVGRLHYRIHPLLRSHLRADLQRRRPDLVTGLHATAADWFAARHRPVRALAHARLAGDPDQVAGLLRREAFALIAGGEHSVVSSALDWLAGTAPADQPWFDLVGALVALESGPLADADARLARASGAWPADPESELVALRRLVQGRRAGLAGDPAELTRVVQQVEPGPGPADDHLAPLALLDRAQALVAVGQPGDGAALADRVLADARARRHGYLAARALAVLAGGAGTEGDYPRMTALAEEADAEVPGAEWARSAAAGLTTVMRAYGALLRADPGATEELTTPAPDPDDSLAPMRQALRGAALLDLDRGEEGLRELRSARETARNRPAPVQITANVAVLAHEAALALGRGDLARSTLAWAEEVLAGAGEVAVLHGRRLAALGRHAAVEEVLRPVLDGTSVPVLPWVRVEARVLACRTALLTGRRAIARHELHLAVAEAAASGVLRPLAFGPVPVVDLLIRLLGSLGELEPTAARVLAARHAVASGRSPVRLTERERDVLALLPTQRSLQEIAGELTVSQSTVKTHVKAIYAKLDARSRREAVTTARRIGLLSASG